jgi:hypothetical protein
MWLRRELSLQVDPQTLFFDATQRQAQNLWVGLQLGEAFEQQ